MKRIVPAVLLLLAAAGAGAQERPFGTQREQAEVRQEWLRLRLDRVLPRLMREHDVDMWIVPMREYNEDPVFRALVSPVTMAARRRTIYVFHDPGDGRGIERIPRRRTSVPSCRRSATSASIAEPNSGRLRGMPRRRRRRWPAGRFGGIPPSRRTWDYWAPRR
jgi:hypothetical protein